MPSRRQCCCTFPCDIFTDDFNDGSTTTIAGWTELVGDSEIVSNELQIPSAGVLLCDTPNPVFSRTGQVFVDMVDIQSGDKWEVRIGSDITGVTYDYAQVRASGTHLFIAVNGGTEVEVTTYTAGDTHRMQVCRSFDSIWATIEARIPAAYACATADSVTSLRFVCLVNWGTSDVLFDNFDFDQHEHTNSTCGGCACLCDGICVEPTLTATFVATEDCISLDGETITLNFVHSEGSSADGCQWFGEADLPDWDGSGAGGLKHWELSFHDEGRVGCDGGGSGYLLCKEAGTTDTGWDTGLGCIGDEGKTGEDCVCDPFFVNFGEFRVDTSGEPGVHCGYHIEITE